MGPHTLYSAYRDDLFKRLRALFPWDLAHAEDLVQRVFARLSRKGAPRYERRTEGRNSKPESWLFGQAKDLMREDQRDAGRRIPLETSEDEGICDPPARLNDTPAGGLQREQLEAAWLAQTEPRYLKVLAFCEEEEGTQEQAAVKFGLPLGTVASWIRTAQRDRAAFYAEEYGSTRTDFTRRLPLGTTVHSSRRGALATHPRASLKDASSAVPLQEIKAPAARRPAERTARHSRVDRDAPTPFASHLPPGHPGVPSDPEDE